MYSTLLGSNLHTYSSDAGTAIAVDGQGDAYVTGDTEYNFPTTTGAFQTTSIGVNEAFVAKFDPAGRVSVARLLDVPRRQRR